MRKSNDHFAPSWTDDNPLFRRYFFNLFKSKKEKTVVPGRPEAIPPAELKKRVIGLGRGKK